MTISVASAIVVILLGVSANTLDAAPNNRAVYNIPAVFDPEPGRVDTNTGTVRINASEFSFIMTEEVLAAGVDGFTPQLHGVSQSTMVIVNVYDPAVHDDWQPPPHVVENWNNIWTMSGSWSKGCLWDEKDNLTGYYRLHRYCDPEPHPNASFLLIDRIPDTSKPRPPNQEYIKGLCRLQQNFVRPEDGVYHWCQFKRRTPRKDQFGFRLYGDNVKYLDEVERFISGKLTEWKER